jgi:5-hydroxyisourate hydrolase
MSAITTHVLDSSRGRPAAGVSVSLDRREASGEWRRLGRGQTDAEGRLRTLLPEGSALVPGTHRLTFETRRYFEAAGMPVFYPEVVVTFETAAGETHYHVPLLVSPFGYTTYRGS